MSGLIGIFVEPLPFFFRNAYGKVSLDRVLDGSRRQGTSPVSRIQGRPQPPRRGPSDCSATVCKSRSTVKLNGLARHRVHLVQTAHLFCQRLFTITRPLTIGAESRHRCIGAQGRSFRPCHRGAACRRYARFRSRSLRRHNRSRSKEAHWGDTCGGWIITISIMGRSGRCDSMKRNVRGVALILGCTS